MSFNSKVPCISNIIEEIEESIKGGFMRDPETGKVSLLWGRTKADLERAKEIIQNFDALLITAGPGMSESSGYSEIRSNKVKLIN